jgi:ParB family chromosome partitioning protein
MTNAQAKIVLNQSQDIPFNKLILSQANVGKVKAGVSVEELAEDISRRGLLQSLSVRPVRGADGAPTGMYEIPAGGRRYRALQLLVKQKRLGKTQAIPCLVRTDGIAEEDSLAENVQRVALHPLDQFRAFEALREQGLGEEEIAARFFVSTHVVCQRLKLASVSPKLLELYAEDEMTLEQLMAFTVTDDHARQERVWAALSHNKSPYLIRQDLTEGAVHTSDKRAQFVGLESYEAAGGAILRDLFDEDEEGWLQDTALLERLVAEKLQQEAEQLRAEGWKWIAAAADFPYGHTSGMRRVLGAERPLTDEEQETCDALQAELTALEEAHGNADELPDEVDARIGEIETLLQSFDDRPAIYDPSDVARAGAFLSIDRNGNIKIDRGYVRREDDAPDLREHTRKADRPGDDDANPAPCVTVITVGDHAGNDDASEAEEDGITPLPERLVTELTAYRTVALRAALANEPDTAFLAVLHALCLDAFYHATRRTCLDIAVKTVGFEVQGPDLKESAVAHALDAKRAHWDALLPEDPDALWDALTTFDPDQHAALFAYCAALSVNALHERWNRAPGRYRHADQLTQALQLDMAEAGWVPTAGNYLGRVTKARILEAVGEAKGDSATQLIAHLKKGDMAKEAERLLAGTGWLPEPLRAPEADMAPVVEEDAEALPDFLSGDDADDGAQIGTALQEAE